MVRRRRCDIGLGGSSTVTLAEARAKASELRRIAKAGGDPIAQRKASSMVPTFAEAAVSAFENHRGSWKNAKHISQWINTLRTYAFPIIGAHRVDQIGTPDVLKVLTPIWIAKPETARRVKQRIKTVLDWSKTLGHRTGENPVDGVSKGLPRQPNTKGHHKALAYQKVPNFIRELRSSSATMAIKLSFEFLILTAARTNEVLGMKWSEIERDVWIIPSERTKTDRQHRVPLGSRCQEILREARSLAGNSAFVFPGRSIEKHLSNMVFLMTLRRMNNFSEITAHGFRSSFRDWAAERTSFPRDICEVALGHAIESKAEAAYRRSDQLDKRRELMAMWEQFVSGASRHARPRKL